MSKELQRIFLDFLSAIFISFFLFFITTKTTATAYFLILDLILAFIIIKYWNNVNQKMFKRIITFTIGSIIAYYIYSLGGQVGDHYNKYLEVFVQYIFLIEFILLLHLLLVSKSTVSNRDNDSSSKEILNVRKNDLKRLIDNILEYNNVGLNGNRGSGKTYLVKKMREDEEVRKTFEFIKIDVLTFQLGEIECVLINEIESILLKHNIFSNFYKEINLFSGASIEKKVLGYLNENESVSDRFSKLVDNINKLPDDKKILIIFDDIDRLSNEESIKKILALAERFSECSKIHILHLFGYEYLEDQEIDRRFLEKYIPHVVNLTALDYKKTTEELWEELSDSEKEKLKEYSKIVFEMEYPKTLSVNEVNFEFWPPHAKINSAQTTVRSIELFIEDIRYFLTADDFLKFNKDKVSVLLAFLYIKHLMPEQYAEIYKYNSLLEAKLFEIDGKPADIRTVKAKLNKNDEKTIFETKQNHEELKVFCLLGYDIDVIALDSYQEWFDNGTLASDYQGYKAKKVNNNQEINRVTEYVLAAGNSENSDLRQAIKDICEHVLCKTNEDEQQQAWNELIEKMHPIFLISVDKYRLPFQGMKMFSVIVGSEYYSNFIEFYFRQVRKKGITLNMIENLSCCEVYIRKVFIKTINEFCQCKIEGNFNQKEIFYTFLEKYMEAIIYHGYVAAHRLEFKYIINEKTQDDKFNVENILKELEYFKEHLESQITKEAIAPIKTELEYVEAFLEQCINIMKCEKKFKEEPSITVSTKSVFKNKKIFDELSLELEKTDHNDLEQFKEKITSLFETCTIDIRTCRMIYEKIRERENTIKNDLNFNENVDL